MNKRSMNLLTALLCAVALLLSACREGQHQEEREVVTRATGEAASNPYHAAELLLQESGYETKKVIGLPRTKRFPQTATLILSGATMSGLKNPTQVDELIEWVENGGHLFLDLSGEDFSSSNSDEDSESEKEQTLRDLLLKKLNVTERGTYSYTKSRITDEGFEDIHFEGVSIPSQLVSSRVFRLPAAIKKTESIPFAEAITRARYEQLARCNAIGSTDKGLCDWEGTQIYQTENGYVQLSGLLAARYPLGQGQVTLASLSPFDNERIKKARNAELFLRLATLPDKQERTTYFSLRPDSLSLFQWLFANAPYVLWALLGLLILALWRVSIRFGAILPPESTDRPGLLTHLSAVGAFHARRADYGAMIAPLREEVLRALQPLRLQHPDIKDMSALAAKVSGMSHEELSLALEFNPVDLASFILAVHRLTKLLDHLRGVRLLR